MFFPPAHGLRAYGGRHRAGEGRGECSVVALTWATTGHYPTTVHWCFRSKSGRPFARVKALLYQLPPFYQFPFSLAFGPIIFAEYATLVTVMLELEVARSHVN